MRTSHLAIRRMIAEEKSKLTNEQIFASPAYASYLTDIAEGVTKRYNRTCKVRTYWDERKEAGIACTDNRIIRVNTGNCLTQSFPTRH